MQHYHARLLCNLAGIYIFIFALFSYNVRNILLEIVRTLMVNI